jgi:hypothetical protein
MKEDGWLIQDGNKFELTERESLRQGRCSPNFRIAADF